MRYFGPKNRLARRRGVDLGLKTPGSKSHQNLLRKLNIPPGQHGTSKRRRKLSDYGIQLKEKQKLKIIYGVTEKQMKNYFKKASKTLGNTAQFLSQYLERRLDNVIYRLGFTPTRGSARQLTVHGHILVNDKKVAIPSYMVKIGDLITFKNKKTAEIPFIFKTIEKKDIIIPSWLKREGLAGKIIALSKQADVRDDVNLQLVIEFYSR